VVKGRGEKGSGPSGETRLVGLNGRKKEKGIFLFGLKNLGRNSKRFEMDSRGRFEGGILAMALCTSNKTQSLKLT
jgi:hypothetical protein